MRPRMEDIETLINNLGLKDEMDKLAKIFKENFMIEGEVTENLEEALHRSPDSLIDMIFEKTEEMSLESVGRKEKEHILLSDIPKNLESQMIFMNLNKLKVLIRVMNQYPIEPMETTIVNEQFVPRGWVFNFVQDNECTFIVTEQVRQVLMKLEQDDVKQQMKFAFGIRCVMNTCVRLYGVFGKDLFVDIYTKMALEGQDYESMNLEVEENLETLLRVFEDEQIIYRKGNNIVCCKIESEEQYTDIINSHIGKNNYMPNDHDIEAYCFGKWVDKTAEYDAVYSCLKREIKDSEYAEEMLEEILERIVVDDWGIPQIMNCLYDWEVEFDSPQSARRMTKSLSEWIYSVRRWSEYGYSRKEKQLPNDQEEYIAYKNLNTEKATAKRKIYPNDPCPCGSGKKYKKCCGRTL